jgi:hypothetical protein
VISDFTAPTRKWAAMTARIPLMKKNGMIGMNALGFVGSQGTKVAEPRSE